MFRDPRYFRALREQVVPVLRDLSVAQGLGRRLQHRRGGLFARDPAARGGPARPHASSTRPTSTRRALRKAEAGVYDARPLRASSADNYRQAGGTRLAVRLLHRRLRRRGVRPRAAASAIVFSDHSLATDSVFAEVQLVSCRNVLIYFDRALQDRALGLLQRVALPQGLPRPRHQGDAALLHRRAALRRGPARRPHLPEAGMTIDTSRVEAVVIGGSAGAIDALLGSCCRRCRRRCACRSSSCCTCRRTGRARSPSVFGRGGAPPVKEADDKEPLAPGTVYFAPPGYHLLVEPTRTLALSVDEPVHFSRPSIDVLFESAADAFGQRPDRHRADAAPTQDGARRPRRDRARPAASRSCSRRTRAEHPAMPQAALAATTAAHVLSLDDIAAALATLAAPAATPQARHTDGRHRQVPARRRRRREPGRARGAAPPRRPRAA